MNTTTNRAGSKRQTLLATVSIAALLAASGATAQAAGDADRPVLWLELGGQLSGQSGRDEPFLPPFTSIGAQHGLIALAPLEKPPAYSFDENAELTFHPEHSSWLFSASLEYGRSSAHKHDFQTLPPSSLSIFGGNAQEYPHRNGQGYEGADPPHADYAAQSSERHLILDFTAGKDVGLGMMGHNSTSQIDFGVRIAQFNSKASLNLYGAPYPHMHGTKYISFLQSSIFTNIYDQNYSAKPEIKRSFRGLGPIVSWTGSAPMVGLGDDSSIAFDWGVNAALLFGRQKAKIHHDTVGTKWYEEKLLHPSRNFQPLYITNQYEHQSNIARSRNVTVPNVGGMAGFSLQFPNAKVSIGYRADFFFGAMDGGVDAPKSETRGFFGPYASVSIGIGG